jgi:broad specificity phosphatase PhoE
MRVTFLRHGPLLPPYHDYGQLSLTELTNLAKQDIDPPIDVIATQQKLQVNQVLQKEYQLVLVSPSQRTRNTAQVIGQEIPLPPYQIRAELKEILFDPQQLVTAAEYQSQGLAAIRRNLFTALVTGQNLETGGEVVSRLEKFRTELLTQPVDSVLVVTHGFLLRFIELLYKDQHPTVTETNLLQATNYDYASGFTILMN